MDAGEEWDTKRANNKQEDDQEKDRRPRKTYATRMNRRRSQLRMSTAETKARATAAKRKQ